MGEFLTANSFFCVMLTLSAFQIGRMVQNRWKNPLLNPIILSAGMICVILILCRIPVDTYQEGCAPLQYLLTPATICYAIGFYEQLTALKKHLPAIFIGVLCGTVVGLGSIRLLAALFSLDRVLIASLLPKSITTAIGMALSQEAGGIVALTTTVIALTGILGNVFAPMLSKFFHLEDPIAQGVAIGTCSHALGTARAMEMSQLAGAVSSLSLTFAGLITVVLYSFLIP